MGYSFGAGVALQTAIRHPGVVDRLVLVSGSMKQDGFFPEGGGLQTVGGPRGHIRSGYEGLAVGQTYPDVDWTNLFKKVCDMTKHPPTVSADVANVQARTLLVFADADAMRPEHMVGVWKALGGGQRDAGIYGSLRPANQMAIVPNTRTTRSPSIRDCRRSSSAFSALHKS